MFQQVPYLKLTQPLKEGGWEATCCFCFWERLFSGYPPVSFRGGYLHHRLRAGGCNQQIHFSPSPMYFSSGVKPCLSCLEQTAQSVEFCYNCIFRGRLYDY